jgi:hypothetical protein
MTTYDNQEQYNKYTEYPNLSYNTISYLMDHNELIWKLLFYNDSEAWNKGNLTHSQKASLVYDGSPDETKFNVFMDTGQDYAWTRETTVLRIFPAELTPSNYIYGEVLMGFEIYSYYKLNHLSNYQIRVDVIVQQLLETLNGAEIGGLGRLYFDISAAPKNRAIVIGQLPWKGKGLLMSNHLAS